MSKWLFQTHPLITSQDLPKLPSELRTKFWDDYRSALASDPYRSSGIPNHSLSGKLLNYRALEVDWAGTAYRLVYRIYESPAPHRVLVLSFDKHNPAYDKAKARTIRR